MMIKRKIKSSRIFWCIWKAEQRKHLVNINFYFDLATCMSQLSMPTLAFTGFRYMQQEDHQAQLAHLDLSTIVYMYIYFI